MTNESPDTASGLPKTPETAPPQSAGIPPYAPPPWAQPGPYGAYPQYVRKPKERRPVTAREMTLIPAALAIAVTLDRLANASFTAADGSLAFFMGIFWLAYTAVAYALNWKALRGRKDLWFIAGCAALLCVWNFFFDYRNEYGTLTLLVVPGLLMAHAVLAPAGIDRKRIALIFTRYMSGWFVKPFSAIARLFESIAEFFRIIRGRKLYMALLGAAAAVPLLAVVVPLLAGADAVFSRGVTNLFRDFSFPSLVGHSILVAAAAMFFFSFFWNCFLQDGKTPPQKEKKSADVLFSAVALGLVLCVYVVFDVVQFAYLFARAGLPEGMSYAEYAVGGFWQLILVASINLTLYGVFLHYTPQNAAVRAQLLLLLGLTGIMIISAFARLTLYVERFGMTWLRLLSYWFMIFLAAVLILAAVRMFKPKMPLVFICALLLAGWFVALGYSNPSRMVTDHNLRHGGEIDGDWTAGNSYIVEYASDDGLLAALSRAKESGTGTIWISQRRLDFTACGRSLSSFLARRELDGFSVSVSP